MSEQTLSISEAQKELTQLPDQFEEGLDVVTVTRYGKPVMTILSSDTYKKLRETLDALLETIEIQQDEELMVAFRQGVEDIKASRVAPWEDVKKELGLQQ